jgi:hypothetical protein
VKVTVPSEKDPGVTYEVDLDAQTCTCPHFQARLKGTGKLCKHLAQAGLDALPPLGQTVPGPAVAIPLGQVPTAEPTDTIPWETLGEVPDEPAPPTAAEEAFWAELMKPDPDPEVLAVAVRDETRLQEATAGHLVRAILKAEASVEQLEKRARADAQAWSEMIAKASAHSDAWRAMVLGWMRRNEVKNLSSPWWTVYISKGRPSLKVLDEEKTIAACEKHYPKAVETKKVLVMKELKVALDSLPKVFAERPGDIAGVTLPAIAEEKTGEPSLGIRKK